MSILLVLITISVGVLGKNKSVNAAFPSTINALIKDSKLNPDIGAALKDKLRAAQQQSNKGQ